MNRAKVIAIPILAGGYLTALLLFRPAPPEPGLIPQPSELAVEIPEVTESVLGSISPTPTGTNADVT